jgi:hypothetical protein
MGRRILFLIVFAAFGHTSMAQKSDPAWRKADSFIREYIQLSRLGPGYSREMSPEIIDQFRDLFERDAFLFWDLTRSATDSIFPQLSVNDYVDRVAKSYQNRQPLLDYPSVRIKIGNDRENAFVYLSKTNLVVDDAEQPIVKNRVKLRVSVNLAKEPPLIRNIFEDKRQSPVRSVSAGINYVAWSSVLSMLIYHPHVHVAGNEQYNEITFTPGRTIQAGGMAEFRMNREGPGGLSFSTGFFYSQMYLSSSMLDYVKSFPDTIYKGTPNPLACTTFERSLEIWEKIWIKRVEVPLLFKTYMNEWIYLKSGTCLSYITATSDVNYVLSRTGGGQVTNLTTQESWFLDEDHELDQQESGYYRNRKVSFSKEQFIRRMILSFHLSLGIEKQVGHFGLELEPNISLGMNPLSNKSLTNSYPLNNPDNFNSVIKTTTRPAYEFTFGMRLLVSYLF